MNIFLCVALINLLKLFMLSRSIGFLFNDKTTILLKYKTYKLYKIRLVNKNLLSKRK